MTIRTGVCRLLAAAGVLLSLAACGGGGEAVGEPEGTAPPVVSLDTLDAAGGTVDDAVSGVTVTVPAGALDAEVTIRVAADSTGAPPLPASMRMVGSTYEITPHGRSFARAVTVRLPVPADARDASLVLLHARPGGDWIPLAATGRGDATLAAEVDTLGWFTVVASPPAKAAAAATNVPLVLTSLALCDGQLCNGVGGTPLVTYSVTTNRGDLPAGCPALGPNNEVPTLQARFYEVSDSPKSTEIRQRAPTITYFAANFVGPNAYTEPIISTHPVKRPTWTTIVSIRLTLQCPGSEVETLMAESIIRWKPLPAYPALLVESTPTSLTAAPGKTAALEVIFAGGAAREVAGVFTTPTVGNSAVIDWQRSDDAGGSWRSIGTSYQYESGNKLPFAGWPIWRFWTARIGIPVTAADSGARFRARACYTPPDVAPPPCVASRPAVLSLLQATSAPQITTPPVPRLISPGQTASFSVVATGLPAPTLQWQTRPANATAEWTDLAGATAASYTTRVLSRFDNGIQYRVVATNSVGVATGLPVTVSVGPPVAPSIVTAPAAIAVVTGSDAVFAVRATGTDALSFQWRRNGVNLTGANGAVLRLAAVTATNAGDYSVVVTNARGSVTSVAARLTVNAVPVTTSAPSIVAQPAGASVAQGQSVTFSVGFSGTAPFTYQWRKGGTAIGGAAGASYTIASAQTSHQGSYSVVITNAKGSVTSAAATLSVTPAVAPVAPSIVTQPVSVVAVPGSTTTLAVAATGTGPLSYQWYLDGAIMTSATSNSAALTIDSIDAIFAGQYTVKVSNAQGEVTSEPASLIVVGTPQVGAVADVYDVPEGSTGTFTISATGSQLRYQWTRNNVAIPDATAATYETPVLTLADSGAVYGVIVYNGAGLVIVPGTVLTVTPAGPPPGLVLFAGAFGEVNNVGNGDGTGTAARFNEPRGLVADASGNLYVANRNGGFVSKVTPGAVVTRIAEHGFSGALALGADGSLLSMQVAGGTQANLRILAPLQAGAATQARNCGSPICGFTVSPGRPFAAIAADGTVYTAWQDANFISVTSGPLSDVNPPIAFFAGTTDLLNRPAGWVDGTGTSARFDSPSGIVIGPDGNLYVADTNNHVIRRITPQGAVSTFAGTGTVAGSADGALLSARFNRPLNLGFDSEGSLWVQEIGPANAPRTSLRKIAGGQVSTPVADLQAEIDAVAGGPTSSAVVNGFTRNYGGLAVLGPKRIAFTVTHALLVLTLP